MKPARQTVITITKEAHDKLLLIFAIRPVDLSATTFHPDGRVSFPIRNRTLMRLKKLDPDIELAVRILVGLKAN